MLVQFGTLVVYSRGAAVRLWYTGYTKKREQQKGRRERERLLREAGERDEREREVRAS